MSEELTPPDDLAEEMLPLEPQTLNFTWRDMKFMLDEVFELAEANGSLPEAAYHVVVIPDGDSPHWHEFPTAKEAAAYGRTLYGQDAKALFYYGRRCLTTKLPAKYLLTHEGRFPLFDEGDSEEIDDSGSMTLSEPLPVKPPATDDPDDTPDEDDDEDGEDEEDDGDDE